MESDTDKRTKAMLEFAKYRAEPFPKESLPPPEQIIGMTEEMAEAMPNLVHGFPRKRSRKG